MRDFLATAASVENAPTVFHKTLALVTRPDAGAFKPWQLAAVLGALDALDRQDKSWDKLAGRAEGGRAGGGARADGLREGGRAEADLLAAIPLLGRDKAKATDDLKCVGKLLDATRPTVVQSAAVASRSPAVPIPLRSRYSWGAWSDGSPAIRARARRAPRPARVAE